LTDDTTITQQFIEALAALERDRDPEPMRRLFAADSQIGNIVSPREFSGPEGAHTFWDAYRETFGDVASTFRNVIVGNGRAALEWTTTGTSVQGAAITYAGVSILEFADGQISRFWAYFDPSDLGRQMEPNASSGG
jgi:ketosteroid isomerase-like protein